MAQHKRSTSFEVALKNFKRSVKSSMRYARDCAELALEHFAEHGNTSKLTTFLEAMPDNYLRKAALVKWAVTFAPLSLESKKFVKDMTRKDMKIDLKAAFEKPFWDFAPEPEIKNFTADDLLANVQTLIRRYENAERMKAADEQAERTLKALKQAVENVKVPAAPAETLAESVAA